MTEQSYFIQNLIEVTPIGIIIMDFDGLISNMNPASKNILGIKQKMKGKNLFDTDSELIQKIKNIDSSKPNIISIQRSLLCFPFNCDVATLNRTHKLKSMSPNLGVSNDQKKSNLLPRRI